MNGTFPIQQQQEADWCWAAVAVSVEHYFSPASTLNQEQLAKTVLTKRGQISQAADCNTGVCDLPWYLEDALSSINKLRQTLADQILSFSALQQQLRASLPVCARIAWDGGNAHFVVICGSAVSPGGIQQVYVADPLLRDSNVVLWSYAGFIAGYSDGYGGEGQWVDSYLLQP